MHGSERYSSATACCSKIMVGWAYCCSQLILSAVGQSRYPALLCDIVTVAVILAAELLMLLFGVQAYKRYL